MKIFTKNLILAILLLAGLTVQAQKSGNVKGRIIDSKEKKPVDYASVVIKSTIGDSSVVGSAVTVPTGVFEIKGLAPGNYKFYAAFLGFKTFIKMINIPADKTDLNMGDIVLEDEGVTLDGVAIKGEIPPMRVKKDTLEFNAGSFKVKENAVVEDVLKKLPGVDVDKAGTITTQGETIKKIRVDGKDFMGNDPLLATRNLPADMIDKIQIIDDLSDQAKFSGVDDGNREKIINITTKQDKKNGYFGNSSVGYGTDDRYDANINVNKFKGNQQFSFIGQFNNVNKQNFGGAGGGSGGGGGGRQTFNIGGGSAGAGGITTTNAAGFNFADVYTDDMQINGSYFFNKTSNLNTSNSFTQNLFGNNSSTVNNQARATTDRINHRINFTIDTKLDSTTSIRMQPNFSYSESEGLSSNVYNRNVLNTITDGSQQYNTRGQTPSFSNNLLLRKKFQRRGRTISLNVNTNINDNDANNYNIISDYVTTAGSSIVIPNLTNQLNDNSGKTISNTARLVYTEPLSKTLNLELNYQNGYNFDNSEKLVYNYNAITNLYDMLDPSFTNTFETTTLSNSLGFSFNKNEKKYNWNVGLAVLNTNRDNVNKNTGDVINQDFYNLTPTAQYRYIFSQSKRLEIRYRGNTQQPSIQQIQPVPDNTNSQSFVVGNPDLRPSFSNNFNLNYRNFNFSTFRNFFVYANFTQTFNDFASDSRLVTDINDVNYGKIATKSVNVDGNYNAFFGFSIGQPIVKGNKLTLNLGGGANLIRSMGFANGNENTQKNLGINGNLKLVSNLDKLDLTAGMNVRYDNSTFSFQTASNTDYYTITPSIDVSYLFPGNIRLQSDVYYNKTTGRGPGYDIDYTLVNGYISRQFFKNRGTFKVAVNDLLNENTGISRTATANQIQDMTFNVLKRYYMFSFTYSLNRVGGRTMGADRGGMGAPGMQIRQGGRN